jgi:tRNA(Ile2) C34 agmatinyltransferase TiaS
MTGTFREIPLDELEKAAGGVQQIVNSERGRTLTVTGLDGDGWLAVRSQPVTRDEYIIGRLVNGDQVEVMGSVNVSPDPNVVNYVWAYVPGLKISGWVNSRYIQ